jgi:hypothetical protein
MAAVRHGALQRQDIPGRLRRSACHGAVPAAASSRVRRPELVKTPIVAAREEHPQRLTIDLVAGVVVVPVLIEGIEKRRQDAASR